MAMQVGKSSVRNLKGAGTIPPKVFSRLVQLVYATAVARSQAKVDLNKVAGGESVDRTLCKGVYAALLS